MAGELAVEAGEEGLLVEARVGPADLGALRGGSPAEDLHQGLLVRAPALRRKSTNKLERLTQNAQKGEDQHVCSASTLPCTAFLRLSASAAGDGRGVGTAMVAISRALAALCSQNARTEDDDDSMERGEEEGIAAFPWWEGACGPRACTRDSGWNGWAPRSNFLGR